MANITAAMVKELRELSGAGMMDCKKALAECDGNMEEAVDFLRKSGAMKAEKKASRIAAEGICRIAIDGGKAVVVEVNSETDFVSKNEVFQAFVEKVAEQALASNATDVDGLLAETWAEDTSKTVKEALVEKVATIGENLNIRRFEKLEGDTVVGYIHGGGRIGVIVAANTDVKNDAIDEALKNVAMQIAALNAKYVSEAEIDADYIAHEKEILKAQIMADPKESQKPEKVIDGMIQGRIKKELKEVCLLDQVYVRAEDGKQTVGQYVAEVAKANGANLNITKFVRFETGEGLEKKSEDFAAEVAAQIG